MLHLTACQHTMIGDEDTIGISGGEKRRVSIASRLLGSSTVLFLDEITTGLDFTSALITMQVLSKLVKSGVTVIVSIHQPSQDIFELFDHVILLSKGQVVYCDTRVQMEGYFEALGYPLSKDCNPADHYIDICSIDGRSQKSIELCTHRCNK